MLLEFQKADILGSVSHTTISPLLVFLNLMAIIASFLVDSE
jgi:hypothetical protein